MNDNLRYKFYENKDTEKINCNFDLKELMDNFSFSNFIVNSMQRTNIDSGAILLCTPKQYILAYNTGFGTGTHGVTFGRALKDIKGGGFISSKDEILDLANKCEKTYLCARFICEWTVLSGYDIPIFRSRLVFMTGKSYNHEMFESFKKFFDNYKEEIESVVNKYDCCIEYYSKEKKKRLETKNINEVYDYLENHIDYDYHVDEDEIVIGVSNKEELTM